MGREEAEAAASFFQDIKSGGQHKLVVQRTYASYEILYEVRELVAETEGYQCGSSGYKTLLPSQPHKKEDYYDDIHRYPDRNVRKELPDTVCDGRIPTVDGQRKLLVKSVNFLPEHL